MKIKSGFLLLLISQFAFCSYLNAQETKADSALHEVVDSMMARNYDFVYSERIGMNRIKALNSKETDGVISIFPSSKIELIFEDLGEDYLDYEYEIVHCDKLWNPDDDEEKDFFEGKYSSRIEEVKFSSATKVAFSQYRLVLPGEGQKFLRSGNYLLHIKDEDDGNYFLTRRFMVVRPAVNINAEVGRTYDVSLSDYKQQVLFEILDERGVISDVSNLYPVVLKNSSWDIRCEGSKPTYVSNGKIRYDGLNNCVFDAGNEFRFFNMLEYRNLSNNIVRSQIRPNGMKEFWLDKEKERSFLQYLEQPDENGGLLFESEIRSFPLTELDYVFVNFTLATTVPMFEHEIYLFGEVSQYRLDESFKLIYDAEKGAYTLRKLLKQGLYNYEYVVNSIYSESPDEVMIEGSHYETENDYTILLYFSNVYEGYDELLSICRINSRKK